MFNFLDIIKNVNLDALLKIKKHIFYNMIFFMNS